MTFEEWFKKRHGEEPIECFTEEHANYTYLKYEARKTWNHQQAKIDHIREYIVSGLQVAPKNSEYWLALRDCLNELEGLLK